MRFTSNDDGLYFQAPSDSHEGLFVRSRGTSRVSDFSKLSTNDGDKSLHLRVDVNLVAEKESSKEVCQCKEVPGPEFLECIW
jgi:hypothetical protein